MHNKITNHNINHFKKVEKLVNIKLNKIYLSININKLFFIFTLLKKYIKISVYNL